MDNSIPQLQKNIWVFCMFFSPLLITIAQFFWRDGMLSATAGTIQVVAFVLWIFAFQGMFYSIRNDFPQYTIIGFIVAVYACVAGNNFGVDGIYSDAMGLQSLDESKQLIERIGFPALIYLYIPGIFFPLSLLMIGIQLIRARKVSKVAGMVLVIGAVCFPLSRIPRVDWIAHLDNLTLIAGQVLIAKQLFHRKTSKTSWSAA